MQLSAFDRSCLAGEQGEARRFALEMLRSVGEASGAEQLIDVSRAHLVGVYDSGEANLGLLDRLLAMGARVKVPTTLNASSACLGQCPLTDPDERSRARSVVDRYRALGATPTLTCAPYQLEGAPARGECIAWSESNAVVYANSVLGARTNHTVQYLDLCAALTGRIPQTGLYRSVARRATLEIDVSVLEKSGWRDHGGLALLGLWLGEVVECSGRPGRAVIPVLTGLPLDVSRDALRSLGAAAASASSLAMFHAVGLTPEAPDLATATGGRSVERRVLTSADLEATAARFSAPPHAPIRAVCLGTPHYSLGELAALDRALHQQTGPLKVPLIVTLGRHTLARAEQPAPAGSPGAQTHPDHTAARSDSLAGRLRARGVSLVTDQCSYYGRLVSVREGVVMTDSAKWAWYAGGNLGVTPVLASMNRCVASACAGAVVTST